MRISDGDAFLQLARYDRALMEYERAIALDPTALEAYLGRARAYSGQENYEAALADLDFILEQDADFGPAYYQRALIYTDQGQTETALADLNLYLQKEPEATEGYYLRALNYLQLDNYEQALNDLDEALELSPQYTDALRERGLVYALVGNYSAAQPDLVAYVELTGDRNNPQIEAALEDIELFLGPITFSTNISYGGTATGELAGDTYAVEYRFTASAGDVINIRMEATTGTLDPMVILLDAQGNEIARNDDDPLGELGRNSYLRSFVMPSGGTFTIVATRFQEAQGSTTGTYLLTLELAGTGVTTDAPDGMLAYGSVVEGQITGAAWEVRYEFAATAGDIIEIRMERTSGSLDTLLILLDPQGNQIAFNDDDPQSFGTDSRIGNFRIPVTGTYTIVATRFQGQLGSTSGGYRLTLTRMP